MEALEYWDITTKVKPMNYAVKIIEREGITHTSYSK